MTTAAPCLQPRRSEGGDAVPAPAALLAGPGRTWVAEPRWRRVEIRIAGEWRPGRIERWRLRQGSMHWVARVRWGPGARDQGWYLYTPDALRQLSAHGRAADDGG
ncbi:hypothetical protein [Kitasatospora camelliae]|uniref:Uncharacterized protein n=1 Tax=Kitasatospora camelliae TaxID=3156397 RepID=A0AAU8JQ75_9ACTN